MACALALIACASAAYVASEETDGGVITLGNVHIEVAQAGDVGAAQSEAELSIVAGKTLTAATTIQSTGDNPVWVRVAISCPEQLQLSLNTSAWTYSDGYYYCLSALDSGQESEPLFDAVTLASDAQADQTLQLTLNAYAVQSQNNGASVWEAQGWPSAATTSVSLTGDTN